MEEVRGDEVGDRMSEETTYAAKLWRRGRFKYSNEAPTPWLWPVIAVVRAAKRVGWEKGAASLRSLAEGGWPLQQKLWAEGRAKHNICKCKEAAGSLWHKLGRCRLSDQHRNAACAEAVLKAAESSPWDPLYTRGVPARPKDPPFATEYTWHETSGDDGGKVATGCVYTDGSAKGRNWRATRAGWAFVVLKADDSWAWTSKGTLGGPNCSSFRAELKAV